MRDRTDKQLTAGTVKCRILLEQTRFFQIQCQKGRALRAVALMEVRRLTRGDDGHIDQDVHPHLPVEQCLPNVTDFEMLLFADGGVVILCASTSGHVTSDTDQVRTLAMNDPRTLLGSEEGRRVGEVDKD